MAANAATAQASATEPAPETTLTVIRSFDAPMEAVFQAWTVPEQLIQWWGPEGMHVPEHRMDVRDGGSWRTVMRGSEGDHIVAGDYREVSPPDRLVFTWAWETDGARGHETVITISLRDLGGRTELTLTQEDFETKDARDNHRLGWTSSFACLETHLQAAD